MASTTIAAPPTSTRKEWGLLHLSFILIGVITTLLGPILPNFSHRWALTDAQLGLFFTSQYFFSTLGVILTGFFLPRFGFSKVIAAGFVAFFVGFAFLGLGPWFISVFMVGINGFGYGLANPGINLRGTQLPSRNTAAAVTFLNFSWSIGAVLCPFLVGALLPRIHLRGLSLLIAASSVILVALSSLLARCTCQCPRIPRDPPASRLAGASPRTGSNPAPSDFFFYMSASK